MFRRIVAYAVAAFSLAFIPNSTAQISRTSNPFGVQPRDRVVRAIDDEQRIVLQGNRHPLARAEFRIGAAAASYRMDRMILLLRPDASQQKALDDLVTAQHDPQSPYYHQWLTPQSFGQTFGVSDNDLLQVMGWLQAHGMSVEEVAAGRRSIVFSGTAAQVNAAFHTRIQSYRIGGELHHANDSDPQIPQALAGVVGGIASLHDFRSEPLHRQINMPAPSFTSGTAHYLTPADFATIYDVGPLYQNSVNGTGQTVAIVGRTNINISDVRQFRSAFGLPVNDPQIIVNGTDPGITSSGEETEADLDVEWAGALAKNAAVKFVVSASTNSSDGVYLSSQYIVNHNLAPVMSVSFGLCEAALGSGGNSFINGLWQQAASQGITVFVSSGDSGAAGCDSSSASRATAGLGVNGLCSTPYSICVGGTQFNDTSNPGLYWSGSNTAGTQASALSYIPEKVWNESGSALWAGGGGVSSIYSKPSWQTGTGVPADGKRDVPDVSMTAAGHDGYLIYMNGGLGAVGGTSAASPALASVMGLVLQSAGTRQGNANTAFYALAARQRSGGAAVFHDTTTGNNSVPGLAGYAATTGYDQATGLGSVDANILVTHWGDALAVPALQVTAAAAALTVAAGGTANVNLSSSATGGFNAPVALSMTGLPSGVSGSFSPTTISAPGTGSSVLTLSATTGARAGTAAATIVATSGGVTKNLPLAVTVHVPPNFTLGAPGPLTIVAGQRGTMRLTTSGNSTFNSPVNFTISGMPMGLSAGFSPTSISAPGSGSTTLTLTAATAAPGSYTTTIAATGGNVTQRVSATVNVAGFTLRASASAASLAPKGRASLTLTSAIAGGFASAVSFSVTGLPAGVTAVFSPASLGAPGSGSTTLTLTRGSTTNTATANVVVTASGGGVSRTLPVTLTLTSR